MSVISFKKYDLKIALNSVPRPPIPILVKSQSGLMMDWRSTLPLLLPRSRSLKKVANRLPSFMLNAKTVK